MPTLSAPPSTHDRLGLQPLTAEVGQMRQWYRARRSIFGWLGLLGLLVLTLALRIHFFSYSRSHDYNHDIESHTDFVQYVHERHTLPPVDGELEFSQQPLYYLFAAPFYRSDRSPRENMPILALVGLCVSTAGLCVAFRALFYLSSWYVRYGVFIFLAFTPSFIIGAPFVGNDGLLAFFAAWFFLCALRFNRRPTQRHLVLVILALMAALFSKLSALALVAAVPWMLWRASSRDASGRSTTRWMAAIAVLLTLWMGLGAARAWNPEKQSFTYYHGWTWDYMRIKEAPLTYLTRFDLSELIRCGQAATTDDETPDSVRFSFPVWEYGNMLLGEYYFNGNDRLLNAARLVLIVGTPIYLGLLLFFFTVLLGKSFLRVAELLTLNRTMLLMLVTGLALLLAFVALVPNTCTADFRYLLAVAPWLALAVWRGLSLFPRGWALRTLGIATQAGYVAASVWLLLVFLDG